MCRTYIFTQISRQARILTAFFARWTTVRRGWLGSNSFHGECNSFSGVEAYVRGGWYIVMKILRLGKLKVLFLFWILWDDPFVKKIYKFYIENKIVVSAFLNFFIKVSNPNCYYLLVVFAIAMKI